MVANEERDLQEHLAPLGLPDDLPEVALGQVPRPDAAALARIKARALARARAREGAPGQPHALAVTPAPGPTAAPNPTRPAVPRRRWTWAVAAALALAALTTVALPVPRQVLARFLQFVPGFGAREAGEAQWAAARPVRLERNGQWVEVQGLVAGKGTLTVRLSSLGVPLTFDNVYVEDGAGRRYALTGGSTSNNSEGDYDASLWIRGDFAQPGRTVTVGVLGNPDWRLTVDLVPGDQLLAVDQFGPSATVKGYTITGRLESGETLSRVNLLTRSSREGARVFNLGWSDRPVTLTAGGAQPELRLTAHATELIQFETAPMPPGVTEATLTIAAITAEEPGEALLQLPPVTGPVNRTIQLGRWSLRILRTELVEESGRPHLRVFVDPGPDGPESLIAFTELREGDRLLDWSRHYDPVTQRMDSFLIEVSQGAGTLTYTIASPLVRVEGPWTLPLPVHR